MSVLIVIESTDLEYDLFINYSIFFSFSILYMLQPIYEKKIPLQEPDIFYQWVVRSS